jgi:MFS family permease
MFWLNCGGVWLHATDGLVTATIVPAIVQDIGGVAYVAWTLALYQVGAIIAGAATPALAGQRDLGRVLALSALLYGAGCVAAALAPSMALLLAARLLQGAGGGGMLAICYLVIQRDHDAAVWPRLFGIQAIVWAAGSLLGPLIGGLCVQFGTWRDTFWLFAAEAALVVVASWGRPRHGTGPAGSAAPPWRPLLILSVATLAVAEAAEMRSAILAAALGFGGLVLLYAAARLDRAGATRLLPAGLMDVRRPLGAGLMLVFTLSAASTGLATYGPLILSILRGTSALSAGYMLACEALAWTAGTLGVARLPQVGERGAIRAGSVIAAAGTVGLAVAMPAASMAGVIAFGSLQGLGFGVFWPSLMARIVRSAGRTEAGLAAGAPGTVQRIGYAVGAAATGIAANLSGLGASGSAPAARLAGFWIFALFVPVLAAGLISAWQFTRAPE